MTLTNAGVSEIRRIKRHQKIKVEGKADQRRHSVKDFRFYFKLKRNPLKDFRQWGILINFSRLFFSVLFPPQFSIRVYCLYRLGDFILADSYMPIAHFNHFVPSLPTHQLPLASHIYGRDSTCVIYFDHIHAHLLLVLIPSHFFSSSHFLRFALVQYREWPEY